MCNHPNENYSGDYITMWIKRDEEKNENLKSCSSSLLIIASRKNISNDESKWPK